MTVAVPLLAADEPPPYELFNPRGTASILLICDHASRRIPRRLNDLGLDERELSRHIACDIGAADVTRRMALQLNAPALLAGYSRLVIDCNRHLHDPTLMPAVSDGTAVAANAHITEGERQVRIGEIHERYHQAIHDRLERQAANNVSPALLSIHSCTPVMNGQFRPWHIGICWERDQRIARPVLAALRQLSDIVVGDNEPYALTGKDDYSVPRHAMSRGLPHLQVEFRQDLIDTPAGVDRYSEILLEALRSVFADEGLYRTVRV